MKTSLEKTITVEELEEKFDSGEDISEYFDSENAKASLRVMLPAKLVKQLLQISKQEKISLDSLVNKLLQKSLLG